MQHGVMAGLLERQDICITRAFIACWLQMIPRSIPGGPSAFWAQLSCGTRREFPANQIINHLNPRTLT